MSRTFRKPKPRRKGRDAISRSTTAAIIIALAAVVILVVTLYEVPPPGSSASSLLSSTSGAITSTGSTVSVSIPQGAANPSNPPGYAPDAITVVIGVNNTATWTNNDSVPHTVTLAGLFDSANMPAGATWTHVFTTPGTYNYLCTYHSWMKGTVIVKARP